MYYDIRKSFFFFNSKTFIWFISGMVVHKACLNFSFTYWPKQGKRYAYLDRKKNLKLKHNPSILIKIRNIKPITLTSILTIGNELCYSGISLTHVPCRAAVPHPFPRLFLTQNRFKVLNGHLVIKRKEMTFADVTPIWIVSCNQKNDLILSCFTILEV